VAKKATANGDTTDSTTARPSKKPTMMSNPPFSRKRLFEIRESFRFSLPALPCPIVFTSTPGIEFIIQYHSFFMILNHIMNSFFVKTTERIPKIVRLSFTEKRDFSTYIYEYKKQHIKPFQVT